MDGTLTVPNLDFGAMYQRCGVDPKQDILEVLAALPPDESKPKYQIIHDMEDEATRSMKLMPAAPEMVAWLAAHKIPTALVTRNTLQSAKALEERLVDAFDIVIARDGSTRSIDGNDIFPPKPDPTAMKFIADEWKMDPSDMLMVGDSPANDIVFGQAAGAGTALLDTGRKTVEGDKADVEADITVFHMHELPRQLWLNWDIEGDLGTHVPLLKYKLPVPSTPMTQAAMDGIIIEEMKKNPDQLNEVDETGNTPLIWAADAGHTNVVAFLLEQGVDLDTQGYLGATAVCRAARKGQNAVLEQLIEAGANLDIPNIKLQYPLHFAAFKENTETVSLLLKYGANTLVLDRKGRIPAEDTKNEEIRAMIYDSMGLSR